MLKGREGKALGLGSGMSAVVGVSSGAFSVETGPSLARGCRKR